MLRLEGPGCDGDWDNMVTATWLTKIISSCEDLAPFLHKLLFAAISMTGNMNCVAKTEKENSKWNKQILLQFLVTPCMLKAPDLNHDLVRFICLPTMWVPFSP